MNVYELNQEIVADRAKLKSQLDGYAKKKLPDGQEVPEIPANDIEGIRAQNEALNEKVAQRDSLMAAMKASEDDKFTIAVNRIGGDAPKAEAKSWFDDVSQKGAFSNKGVAVETNQNFEFKTTMTTSAGYLPESIRSGVQIDTVQIRPTLMDYLPIVPVSQNAYKFMKESTFTNNAGVKGEAVAFDEAALALSETTVAMNRLGVYLPVTDDQLEDEPAARAYLERRLQEMVKIKAEYQILNGNGTEPQWEGILGLSGIQSMSGASYESPFDALHQAILNVERSDATTYGGGFANLVVMAPADWQQVATARTSDGLYLYGNIVDAVTRRVWGIPVVVNFTLAANTVLVMDTNYFAVGMRRGMTVKTSDSHGELFIAGVQTVRVDIKGNLISYRDSAACKVTSF